MAYTSLGNGFEITGANYIDRRIVLTKAEMLTAEDDYFLPDLYFAYCPDDNLWYFYNVNNEEDPETGKYKPMPAGLVNDVLVNGVSVVEDKIAHVDTIEDVKVDGSSVVEDHIANINLDNKQDKLTQGQYIKIENDVISVDGIEPLKEAYGIKIDPEGNVSIDTEVVPEKTAIPEKTSDLTNDSGFITNSVINLENYYLKTETYTQQEVNDLISSIAGGVTLEVVATLPLVGDTNKIYLVRRSIDSNIYDQYVWFNNSWVQVGSTEVDLSQYYTKTEVDSLLANRLANKQDNLTAGAGISLSGIGNSFISVDMGDTLTTTGNKLDVKPATPFQKGAVAYDDNTIKMNAAGQLYSVGGGGGTTYEPGPNIQISGNVISATDTTYRAGDAIEIDESTAKPTINVLYDDETIHKNRNGELYMDAVPIDAGNGIKITPDGKIAINPSEVADSIDLDGKQDAFELGENVYWTTVSGKKTLNANGGSSPVGSVTFSSILGYPTENANLASALNAKLGNIVAGSSNVTVTKSGDTAMISVTGGSGSSTFAGLTDSPYNNTLLAQALNSKADTPVTVSDISGLAPIATSGNYNDLSNKPTIPNVFNSTITINQGGAYKGSFSLNQENGAVIELDAGGGGGTTPGNGVLSLYKNTETTANRIAQFTANQTSNTSAIIKIPTFSYNTSTGVLTITDN